MSLFNETVARLAKAEKELEEAKRRIAHLERALVQSRKVNELAIRRGWQRNYASHDLPKDLNTLTDDEVEQMFAGKPSFPPSRTVNESIPKNFWQRIREARWIRL